MRTGGPRSSWTGRAERGRRGTVVGQAAGTPALPPEQEAGLGVRPLGTCVHESSFLDGVTPVPPEGHCQCPARAMAAGFTSRAASRWLPRTQEEAQKGTELLHVQETEPVCRARPLGTGRECSRQAQRAASLAGSFWRPGPVRQAEQRPPEAGEARLDAEKGRRETGSAHTHSTSGSPGG